jgi:superfamily I DNA and RNA helicase
MACYGTKEREIIIKWFKDQGLCNPDTFVWTGNEKVKGITALANYLKELHEKKYTEYLEHSEIKAIAENDFGTDISIATIKKAKGNPGNFPEIPPFNIK